MEFKQYYLGCLAHASYLIGSEGEAAVVDPQRDVDEYIADAERLGLRIRHVLLTHVHADFVSGQCELARRTGAVVHISHLAGAEYPHEPLREGTELALGSDVRLRVLETPGHTPESVTLLVFDRTQSDQPRMALTGDTLFIGGVGRPDLVAARGRTPEEMAGMLYDSLHEKLLPLPDDVVIYPAHGAGSACGKGMSEERSSSLGEQRRTNYALQPMSRAAFVQMSVLGLGAPPAYFAHSARYNVQGAPALDELPAPPALDAAAVSALAERGALLLDVRKNVDYGAGHVPGALNVGLGGQFASWCGTLIPNAAPIVLIAHGGAREADEVAEARMRLARVGLERVAGYLAGGVEAWPTALRSVPQIEVGELHGALAGAEVPQVVDVRTPGEYEGGHVPGAVSAPLAELDSHLAALDPARPTAVICAGGYRSSAAIGLMLRHGMTGLRNVLGGTSAWVAAGYPVEVPERVER